MKTVNKNLILSLFKKMNEFKSTNVKSILETYFDKNVTVNITSPFKELTNIKEFNDTFWTPLFNSFPDLENQPYILVGGDYEKRSYVSCTGNFIGTFTKDWLDIPATKQPTWLRYAAHFMIEDNKIVKAWYFFDMLDVMRQAGFNFFPKATTSLKDLASISSNISCSLEKIISSLVLTNSKKFFL